MAEQRIKVGPGRQAFAMGVAAGTKANEELDTPESRAQPFDQRSGYFWLRVGVLFATSGLNTQEAFEMFIAGATMRKPDRTGFACHFETSSAQFHSQDPEADDFDPSCDDEDLAEGIQWVLKRVAADVASGADQGPIRDINGNRIGSFSINEA